MKHFFTRCNTLVFIVDDSILNEPINKYDYLFIHDNYKKIHFILPLSVDETKSYQIVTRTLDFINYIVTYTDIKIGKVILDYNAKYDLISNALRSYHSLRYLWDNHYILNDNTIYRIYIDINHVNKLEFHNDTYWRLISIKFDAIVVIKRYISGKITTDIYEYGKDR